MCEGASLEWNLQFDVTKHTGVFLAYLSVILIWSTTPLAIKWSGEGPGYLFGATGRMSIGLVCVLLAMAVLRQPLPWHRKAWLAYLGAALHIYGAMLAVYWAAQFIPSGWVAVVFGLTPMLTAAMAALWLGESSLTPLKLLAYALGIAGLWVMFGSALQFGPQASWGIAGVLVSACLQAASSVALKRVDARLPALTQLGGGLVLAVPAYWATWAFLDGCWPLSLPVGSLASIVYLGVVATPLGFAFYFYLLKHLAATQVALISLVTPMMALLVGNWANAEPIDTRVWLGAGLIFMALFAHEFGVRRRVRLE
jgi:drug/metabolite transporter (DMT)-like permease